MTRLVLVALLALAGPSAGCRKDAAGSDPVDRPRLEVGRILIGPGIVDPAAEAWVERAFTEAAARQRTFSSDEDAPRRGARIEVLRMDADEGRRVLRVLVAVDPPPGVDEPLDAIVELERSDENVELERDIVLALERAVTILAAKHQLLVPSPETVRGLLGHSDPEVVLLALDHLIMRQEREHADDVVPVLEHGEDRVVLRAIETLGRIGSARHARPMVEAARLADRAYANRLYEALASVGGPDAEGFLQFASRNEDDPALAEVANNALRRARAKGLASDVTSASPRDAPSLRGHR